jgi:hypothetical protein
MATSARPASRNRCQSVRGTYGSKRVQRGCAPQRPGCRPCVVSSVSADGPLRGAPATIALDPGSQPVLTNPARPANAASRNRCQSVRGGCGSKRVQRGCAPQRPGCRPCVASSVSADGPLRGAPATIALDLGSQSAPTNPVSARIPGSDHTAQTNLSVGSRNRAAIHLAGCGPYETPHSDERPITPIYRSPRFNRLDPSPTVIPNCLPPNTFTDRDPP